MKLQAIRVSSEALNTMVLRKVVVLKQEIVFIQIGIFSPWCG
jgi:hypothetical protein